MKTSARYWYWAVTLAWAILRLRRRAVWAGVTIGFALSLCWNWQHPYLYQSKAVILVRGPDERERLMEQLLERDAIEQGHGPVF